MKDTFFKMVGRKVGDGKMITWLRKNKDSLSLRGIERQLNMPDTTLVKAVNGSQKLAKHWYKPLDKFLKNLNSYSK